MSAPCLDSRHCYPAEAPGGDDRLSRPLRVLNPRCVGCGANVGNLEVPYRAALSAVFHEALLTSRGPLSSSNVDTARAVAEAAALTAVGAVRYCCRSLLRNWVGSADCVVGGTESRPGTTTTLRNTQFKPPLTGVDREIHLQSGGAPLTISVHAAPAEAAPTWEVI